MSATSYFEELIKSAQAMISDLYAESRLIDKQVWDQAVPNGLSDFSRYHPLKKRFDLEVVSGTDTVDLPVDAITLDHIDLNRALKKFNCRVVMRDQAFALEWLTAASSSVLAYTVSTPFARDTAMQVIDDGAGKRQLWIEPAPVGSATIRTLYLARHQVTDSVNTLPDNLRDLALQKICSLACLALATLVGGDKETSARYSELSECFNTEYEKRTRFAPFGMLA